MVSFLLISLGFIATACASTEYRHVTLPRLPTEFTTVPQAEFSVPLIGKVPRRQAKKDALSLLRGQNSTTAVLAGAYADDEYLVNVTVGGQEFSLVLDTGSSDTWLVQVNYTCTNITGEVLSESVCNFGPSFSNTSSTFSPLPYNLDTQYGDGDAVLGTVANETVTIAGLTVEQQEIGVVYEASWAHGDGISSGLLGLAYPNLTSVYPDDDPTGDAYHVPYDSFFFSAVREGAVSAPFFSIGVNRGSFDQEVNGTYDPNLGYLAFGGLPPVSVTQNYVTVPVQGYQPVFIPFIPSNASNATHFYYTVDVQGFTFPQSDQVDTFSNNTIIDAGTTLMYVPTDTAALYANAFDPPAKTDPQIQDYYVVLCNATAPELSVTIGDKQFSIDPRDQLLPLGISDDAGNQICGIGMQDGGDPADGQIFILGQAFLHNVVVTFNIQSNELTITQRENY